MAFTACNFNNYFLPHIVAIADVNGDGRLDAAVTKKRSSDICVLLGNGDGSFGAQTTFSTETDSQPWAIVVDDFNHDGYRDLAFTNVGTYKIGVLLGNGDGTFAGLKTFLNGPTISSNSLALVANDFNGDGHLDLVTTDKLSDEIVVLLGMGDGTFGSQTSFYNSFCSQPTSFAAGDFNSDDQMDLAVTSSANYLCVLLGNGDGYFHLSMTLSTETINFPWSAAVGDFNNDSHLDIVIANNVNDNLAVMLGNGDGTFGVKKTYSTGFYSASRFVVVGDFNNDYQLDLAINNYYGQSIGILLGTGNGTFLAQTTFATAGLTFPTFIAIGDFNSDGRLDLVAVDAAHGNMIILLNTCDCCLPEV